ncbi:MAG TPA: HlyD family efflux transporter periplasmic adaptor subunit [Aliidongia sp.]|uniref:efflux RND transporter periplasmic adaptor subunit n=1 Tax=Aliidongia sp. TaxID=1914230 RepID=UPI002DDD2CCB|nr:HlyD family efflux transporter periplasmic adaptor subunit [Aliidongia sp.]HEV2676832.1 HlyD family efflux transporter periplasmic adaptor subunit [Aliidongia sp.]
MDRKRPRRRWTRNRLLGVAAILLLAAGVGFAMVNQGTRSLRLDRQKLTIGTVTQDVFHDSIPVRGEVQALESVVLDTTEAGRVEEILVEAGQTVTEGQPLVRLSNTNLQLETIARETQIIEQINNQRNVQLEFEQAKTNDANSVAGAEYNIVNLSRQIRRQSPLTAHGFTAQETLDNLTDQLEYQKRLKEIAIDGQKRDATLYADVSGQANEIAAHLVDNLSIAKKLLDSLVVRAPVTGQLTALDVRLGEQKDRGQRLGQIDRQTGFKVVVQVDEFYLSRVRTGQSVSLTRNGRKMPLVIAKVFPQVKNGRFEVWLNFAGSAGPGDLRPGEALQGSLQLGDDQPALILPIGPFMETTGGGWAFVLDADGTTASRRPIKTGRRNGTQIELLDGLKPGEKVILSDYADLDRIDQIHIQ